MFDSCWQGEGVKNCLKFVYIINGRPLCKQWLKDDADDDDNDLLKFQLASERTDYETLKWDLVQRAEALNDRSLGLTLELDIKDQVIVQLEQEVARLRAAGVRTVTIRFGMMG